MTALGVVARSSIGAGRSDIFLYGALFAGAVGAFCLTQMVGRGLGVFSDIVAIAGDATCGWSWLLVRALFRPDGAQRSRWPLVLVLILVASGAILRLFGDSVAPLPRMVGNLGQLVSSALLLLAVVEPLRGLSPRLASAERRFRVGFATAYAALLAIAVIWVNGAPTGGAVAHWAIVIKSACAVSALAGMAAAIWYRHRHPLTAPGPGRRRHQAADPTGLAASVQRLMTQEAIYTRQNLKVADIARHLGEPEYKITQCVTGPLGFRNFNHMANRFRVEEAKRQLADGAYDHLPVLTIAYDCGFGSVGPFNRAFKAQAGLTPLQFRNQATLARTTAHLGA